MVVVLYHFLFVMLLSELYVHNKEMFEFTEFCLQ